MTSQASASDRLTRQSRDYARIECAIRFVQANRHRQPELTEVAASVHLSLFHFQRLFSRWAGISPKRFLQFLTKEDAKRRLRESANVLEAALASGLSGPGRLHELLVECEAVTPGEVRRGGEGLDIRYGFHASPFGECLLASTPRGICALRFVAPAGRSAELDLVAGEWPKARWIRDPDRTGALASRAFTGLPHGGGPTRLHLRGTNFQIKVWEALLALPQGSVTTYSALARAIGHQGAARAVGSATGRNPIALLIPCHRVLRSAGEVTGYRWGGTRKQAILAWEAALAEDRAGGAAC
ncbi:MAG: 6-O-methylguanine DNA methyltransferase [Betaproteobacteria bacterium RBG_16_64_18]|nr:MAG: 6-O-methylguanine DNA methyltransferase [Betaproteobacteria bacterium RBG_16_64_18]OGA10692.1 MAG: 6-O-methylguanine DNA methyltransferase [Betaproteobacteria bacterium RIFCSPLOWO2_02_FULL_65_20]